MKVDRSRLPEPGAVRPFTFPPIDKSTLPSGLRVWSVRHAAIPIVSFMLLVRHGSAADPVGQEGLAALTADMLDEGTGDRSAIEMHEALAGIGARLDIDLGSDAALVSVTALSRFADRALTLLADMVARPALTEADFMRVRQLRLHRLTQLRDMPGFVADRTFVKLLYGQHPYGHTPIGGEQSLSALTVDDVRTFYARVVRPWAATLVAVGDCDHAGIERMAGEAFAGWEGVPVAQALRPANTGLTASAEATAVRRSTRRRKPRATVEDSLLNAGPGEVARLTIVPRPGAPQSELRIGHVAVARNTPDYHALVVANTVLGGQFVSRINLNLREDKGFTYGARTGFDFRRWPGPFALQVSVQTAATGRAIEESRGEIAAIRGPRPVTEEELALAVAALTRGYARNFETAEQIGRAVTQLALYDLPDEHFVEFVPRVERITTDEVTRVATEHIDPARLITLVVGDVNSVGRDLRQLGLGDPVILPPETS